MQEQLSGLLIQNGLHVVNGVKRYDFGPVIWFWIGSSVAALVLASTLWNARMRD